MFSPGDEVVCMDASPTPWGEIGLIEGSHYTITAFYRQGDTDPRDGCYWPQDRVDLHGVVNPYNRFWGFKARRFRKVERRRDWQAWLASQPADFEGPKRVPQKVES